MGTPRKINAILLSIKINLSKLVNMCVYKLETHWQNFTEIYSTWVKILQESFRGATFFDSHCKSNSNIKVKVTGAKKRVCVSCLRVLCLQLKDSFVVETGLEFSSRSLSRLIYTVLGFGLK